MSGLKPQSSRFRQLNKNLDTANYRSYLKIGVSFGLADYGIKIWGNYLEYTYAYGKLQGNIKLLSLGHIGNGISVWGLGDILLSGSYRINSFLNISLGVKTPLNKGNAFYKKKPLPMDYQASLGTYDIILGIATGYKKFSLNAGIQYPIVQNGNMFLPIANSTISHIPPTNAFKRAPDILLRLSYPFYIGQKVTLSPSILPIFHLANDQYTDLNNQRQIIRGSQGLTLNLNLYLDYKIDSKQNLQLSLGAPVITRKARPDGLTRHFITNLEYSLALF